MVDQVKSSGHRHFGGSEGILTLAQAFGLAPFTVGVDSGHLEKSKALVAYNLILAVFVLLNVCTSVNGFRSGPEHSNVSLFLDARYDAVNILGNLYVFCSLIRSAWSVESFISAWIRLKIVDGRFSELKVLFDYRKMTNYAYLQFLFFFIAMMVFSISEIVCCTRIGLYYTACFWAILLIPLFYGMIVAALFGCVALLLFQRYWMVNDLIRELFESKSAELNAKTNAIINVNKKIIRQKKCFPHEPPFLVMLQDRKSSCMNENLVTLIRMLRIVHFEMFQLFSDFNVILGTHFLFIFIFCFSCCTINVYFVIIFHIRPFQIEKYISSCFWSILLLFLACYIVLHANLAMNEARRTKDVIHSLLNDARFWDSHIKQEMNSFSMQLMHCSMQFKASGFFNVNSPLLFQNFCISTALVKTKVMQAWWTVTVVMSRRFAKFSATDSGQ